MRWAAPSRACPRGPGKSTSLAAPSPTRVSMAPGQATSKLRSEDGLRTGAAKLRVKPPRAPFQNDNRDGLFDLGLKARDKMLVGLAVVFEQVRLAGDAQHVPGLVGKEADLLADEVGRHDARVPTEDPADLRDVARAEVMRFEPVAAPHLQPFLAGAQQVSFMFFQANADRIGLGVAAGLAVVGQEHVQRGSN